MDARLNISSGLAASTVGSGMRRGRLAPGLAALVIGLLLAAFSAASAQAAAGDISTFAGNGSSGSGGDGGPATSAQLTSPFGITLSGGDALISDFYAHTVRRVNSGGTISRLAGTGSSGYSGDGGPATSARLNEPADTLTDAAGNVYIADFGNARVRKVAPDGTISSFAGTGSSGYSGDGGPAMAARLGNPAGLDIDTAGNIYVADFNSTVRKITPAGIISTVAGTGSSGYSGDGGMATSARINEPTDLAVDGSGNVYIAEYGGHRIRRVSAAGIITTVAGTGSSGSSGNGGPATAAQLRNPVGVDTDSSGNVFIADFGNHVIRRVNAAGIIARVAGTGSGGFSGDGGPATSAQLNNPARVTLTANGDFYISDWTNRRVRKVAGLGSPDAPTLSSATPASPSPSNTPRVLGSASAGSTVTLYTNSTCTSAVAATGTAAQLAAPGLAVPVADDSTTTFWARTTDSGGSVSGCSTSSVTYVEDSTPPNVPSIDSAPASPGNDSTPTWSFSSAAGPQAFECRLERGATVVSDWATCSDPKTYDLSAEPDGTYTFSVRGRDAANNAGSAASASYQLDTAAPSAPTISTEPSTPSDDSAPTWGFSAEAGAALECRLERDATVVSDWAVCTSPKTFDLSAHPDGDYTFSVRASDSAGNTGPAATSGYTLDRSAPAAPAISSLPASPGSDATPAWSFTAEAGASLECRIARGATVVADWGSCSDPKTYDLGSEPDGGYSFSVRATDDAGNTGPAASSAYELDTAAPDAPAIDSSPASPGNDDSPAWSFSGEAGASFECRLERGATTVSAWSSCSDPREYDLSAEPDGSYSFSVRARDAAGNTSSDSSSAYDLDTAAPPAPSLSGPPALENDSTPTWSLSGVASSTLECRLERGATVVSDWATCSDQKTYDLSAEPDGGYTLRARATDAAGNTGLDASAAYELDTLAPGPPSLSSSPPSPGNDVNPSWSFFGEAGASFECRLARGATVVSDWAACSDPKSYDLSAQPDGVYTFSVRARDGAGNAGAPTTSVYELDTAAASPPSIDSAPSSPDNDPTPAWDFSSNEVGVTFECRLARGASVISDWAACAGPASFDLSAEPDGSYAFSVRTKDGAGNLGPAASDTYVLDTDGPSVPAIDSAPTSPGNGSGPSWSFSGDAGASFGCRLERGATVVSDWASCSSPRAFNLALEPDGSYTFRVRASDQAGNTSPAAASSILIDRAAPAVPTIDSAPASPDNDESPSWDFSGEAGASFECRLMLGATVVSDWGACTGPRSYDLSSQPDGNYGFAVRARDAAGNTGPAASSSYALDTTPPAGPSIDSAPSSPGSDQTPDWDFSGPGAAFECRLMRGATVVSDWAACSGSEGYDLTSEPDGSYTFAVRASDTAGNTGPASSDGYVLDTAAPAAPSIDSSPASPGNGGSPSWTFSGEAGAALECRLERGATVVSDWAGCSSPRAYDLATQADGSYTFRVRATDDAGNTGSAASSAYTLDRAAPAAPSISSSSPSSPGSEDMPGWSFSGEAGAALECRLVRGATVVSNWSACTSPESYDLSADPDGLYTVSVRATDAAGNKGASASSSYQLDRSAPAAPSISSEPPSPGNDATPTWGFSGEAGAALECRVTRGASVIEDWAACTGSETADLSLDADGTYRFAVRATDAAGNTGPAASSDYELDTGGPALPTIELAPPSPGSTRSPAWDFSGEAGASFECRLSQGATVVSDWSGCSGPRVYDLLLEPDGTYTFAVRSRDAAGNAGPAETSDYELDTLAPGGPSIDSAPSSPGNDSTPSWEFSGEAGASFECRLDRGATSMSGWAACSDSRTYDLASESDGSYSFFVRATDAAGNTGAVTTSGYDFDASAPGAPSIDAFPASPDDDSSPSWSFSGEAGASFECRLQRGATGVFGWSACSSPEGFDMSAEPDGDYTFSVRASDAAGNTGTPATSAYELDTTAPATPSIDGSPSSPSNGTTPSWSFSGPSGAALECRLERGAAVASDWAACASSQAYDLGSEPDGDYTFLVRSSDAVGNTSAPASSDYTLDSTIPAVPSIDSSPGVVGNDASPAWGFSSDPGATFECRLARGATTVSAWAACSDPETFDLSAEPDGSYSFSVRALNGAGGTSAPATSDYGLDRSAPGAPDITSAPASPDNDAAPSWSFDGEASASYECRLRRGTDVVSDWAACSSPEGFGLSGQPDGSYTFDVRASDAAGNTGPVSSSGYDLDTSAPAQPVIDSSPASPGTATGPSWSFSGEPGAALECRLERGAAVVSDWAACSSPEAYDISSQSDGSYSFSVRARDGAGNTSAPASSGYVLDRTGATVQIHGGPGAAGNDRSPEWAFSAEAGASFECRLERAGASVSAWSACSSPKSFDLSSEPEGTYSFSVRATDSLGNQGAAAGSNYELDTTAPGAPDITGRPASPSSDRSPAWAFSAEPGAALECRLEGGGAVVAGWSACSSPSSHDLGGSPDGRYELAVRATDAAGNTGPATAAGFDLDTTAPEPPEITDGPARSGRDATPSWSFRGEAGANFECALRASAGAVFGPQGCESPQRFDLTSERDGAYALTLRARDAAGNLSRATTADYELDRTPAGGPDPNPHTGAGNPTDVRPPDRLLPEAGTTTEAPGFGDEEPPTDEPKAGNDASGGGSGGGGGGRVGEAISGKLKPAEAGADKRNDEGGSRVLKALGKVASAVARNADKSVFPGLLVAMVVGFFGLQSRIDRNDPKLGLAPVFADPDLEFGPPPPKP